MRRTYRFGLVFGIIGAASLLLFLCWWGLFIRTGSRSDGRYDFDVLGSGDILVFNARDKSSKNDFLCILDRRSQQVRRITTTQGWVEEICLLSKYKAVVAIRYKLSYEDRKSVV